MQTRATLFAFVLAISVLLMTGCSGLNGLMIEPSVGPKGDCRFTIVNGYDDDIAVKFYSRRWRKTRLCKLPRVRSFIQKT